MNEHFLTLKGEKAPSFCKMTVALRKHLKKIYMSTWK